MIRQIRFAQVRAVLLCKGGDLLRQLAAIEGFTISLGNQLQRARLRRVTEDLADFRARPSGAKHSLKPG